MGMHDTTFVICNLPLSSLLSKKCEKFLQKMDEVFFFVVVYFLLELILSSLIILIDCIMKGRLNSC